MPITVSRSGAAFGYGPDGAIFEIADDLPEAYWAHPANAWSPLIASRIPGLEGVRPRRRVFGLCRGRPSDARKGRGAGGHGLRDNRVRLQAYFCR
mgnify:CR=1 FL=1